MECEDYLEDGEEEIETCDKCGKRYTRTTEYDITHRCDPIASECRPEPDGPEFDETDAAAEWAGMEDDHE